MDTAIKAIESNIKSAESMVGHYEKEIAKYEGYKKDQIEKIKILVSDYAELKKKLGIKDAE